MAYDYAGSWDTRANHQAAVFDPDNSTGVSTDLAIRHFTSAGVPVNKLVMGIPLYGRSFCNTDGAGKAFQGVGKGSWEAGEIADLSQLS